MPSLKVSGGNREAVRLGADFARMGIDAALVCMWQTARSVPTDLPVHQLTARNPSNRQAILELPFVLVRFIRWIRARKISTDASNFVFTHYATLPLALLVPRERRFYFVQDTEWRFVGFAPASWALRRIILSFYRYGRLLSANRYLTSTLRSLGLPVELEIPIWADVDFLTTTENMRDIDYAMVLRKGAHKRLDLYLAFLHIVRRHSDLRVAVISPEEEIIAQVRDHAAVSLLRPTVPEMRAVYSRSKCFVHLSDHEGFGLPPLEAMGAGCVPLCRDSGGVRAFMATTPLSSMLVSLQTPIQEIFEKGQALISSEDLQKFSAASRHVFVCGLDTARSRAFGLARLATATQ